MNRFVSDPSRRASALSVARTLIFAALLAPALASTATAQPIDCESSGGTRCRAGIPDAVQGDSVESTITVTPDGACPADATVIDVNVHLDVEHQAVGDLELTLVNDTTTVPLVSDLMGAEPDGFGCPGDDLDVTLNDEAPTAILEAGCAETYPAVGGTFRARGALSLFDGRPRAGDWTLVVRDLERDDHGALRGWSIDVACAFPTLTMDVLDAEASEEGDPAVVRFTRTGSTEFPLDVFVALAGSATAEDYAPIGGIVAIPAGQASVELTIAPVADDAVEPTETVELTVLPGDYDLDGEGVARVTIAGVNESGCDCAASPGAGRSPGAAALVASAALWAFALRRRGSRARARAGRTPRA